VTTSWRQHKAHRMDTLNIESCL